MVTPTGATPVDPKSGAVTPVDPKAGARPPDTKSWLTREESARLLGVTTRTIKNYEGKKQLCPQRALRIIKGQEQEVVVHDPQALQAIHKMVKTKLKSDAITDTSTWYTRNESIDLLRVSTQTLKNYERQDKLHPLRARRRDARGHEQSVVVYDPKELSRLPRGIVPFTQRSAGEIEAHSFEMFEQGKSFREIVIALRQTSETVHGLHERWLDDGGSLLVISEVSKQALEALLGPFTDVTALVELVATMCHEKTNSPTQPTESQEVQGC